jgi:rod shape-determining protein MreC
VFALLKRYRELILVAVLLLVPLGVFFAHAKRPAERSRLDKAIVWIAIPLEKAIGWTVRTTLDAWRGYVALRGARERELELSHRVRDLEVERAQLVADRAEVERLRKLLAFAEPSSDRRFLGARVIGVRLGTTGLQLLTVDRGGDDGVTKGMPVVVAEGVVGRIVSTAGRSADVLVLTDRNSSIAVRVDRTRVRANVRGLGKPDAAKLEYALRAEDLIEGDALVTSGTDGVFPRGLAVGKVTQLERSAHGLFQDARVVPAVDPTRLEEVLVLTSWERPDEALPAAYAPEKRR